MTYFSLDNILKHVTYFKSVSSTCIDPIKMFNEVLFKKYFSRHMEMQMIMSWIFIANTLTRTEAIELADVDEKMLNNMAN